MLSLELGEEVREIEGFPNFFVTSFGRVVSGPNRIHKDYIELKPQLNTGTGYLQVNLRSRGRGYTKQIHNLIGRAFKEYTDENGFEWLHRDDNKLNNRADNLEWGSHKKNMKDAFEKGLVPFDKDCGICERRRNVTRPFEVNIMILGSYKYIGAYTTKEEAREVRDKIYAEYGIVRPVTI